MSVFEAVLRSRVLPVYADDPGSRDGISSGLRKLHSKTSGEDEVRVIFYPRLSDIEALIQMIAKNDKLRVKITLETSGEDVKPYSKRVEKM